MKRRDLTDGECLRIVEALHTRHEDYLNEDEHFRVSGYSTPELVYTRVVLRNEDDSFYYPIECQIDPREDGLTADAALDLLLDFQDYYFSRYLREDRDIYLTIEWGVVEFDDKELQAKGQILNRHLERLADDLIAGNKPN